MVTGPGNAYLTAAKRLLRGLIGIDAEAGPTEIAVLADDTADPVHVAADLVSQAEHDPSAASVLVTTSDALADAVDAELEQQVAATKHTERIRTALTGPQSGTILVGDVADGLAVVDAYAAEHLEIQTAHAREVALQVRNAGAVFIGPWAPVSLGDYCAGSNHVLPTGGCARHSAGLSVQTFLRGVHLVEYTEDALREVAGRVVTLATAEDLPAHGQAVTARFRDAEPGRRPADATDAVTDTDERVVGSEVTLDALPLRDDLRGQDPLRGAAARRRGAAEHQREPLPAAAGAGRRRHRRGARDRRRAAPLPGPRRRRAARRPRRLPHRRHRRAADDGEPVGGQRVQRDPPAGAAGVRRAGPGRGRVRAVVLDAPDHRRRHPHRMAARPRGATTSRSTSRPPRRCSPTGRRT